MKKTTLHHIAMYQNVLAVVNDHQSTWSSVPGMVQAVDQFENLLTNLSNKLNIQNTLMQGIRKDKEEYMNQLIESMSLLKKGLFLHAVQTNNIVLRERNKESLTKLRSMGAERLKIENIALLEDLDTYESALASVGIDAQQIQEYRDKAALIEERKNSVRQAIIERSMETKSIRDLEKQLNELLISQLDRFISFFRTVNNTFFVSYKAARRIIGKSGPGSTKGSLTT